MIDDVSVTKVEAMVPLELPGGGFVQARFEVESNGFITIVFRDEDLGTIIINEALRNRLVHLGFNYAMSVPKEGNGQSEGVGGPTDSSGS